MSCVIGLKYGGKVYMGQDGIASTEDGDTRPIVCEKIFINKQYLIGFCGSVRSGQLLYPYNFDPPDEVLDFPRAVRDHYMENGALLNGTSEVGDRHEANIMIATTNGKLYEMLVDFQMSEVIDFTCLGAGSHFAFGSMETTKRGKGLDPEKRVLLALKIASMYSRTVGPPFTIKVL
jgi:ATP-dependent protease HslVU (ClpYQ) peptidase subunit